MLSPVFWAMFKADLLILTWNWGWIVGNI